MIIGSQDDIVIDQNNFCQWRKYMKPEQDYLWQCQKGNHFFHYFQSELVGQKMIDFWETLKINSGVREKSGLK